MSSNFKLSIKLPVDRKTNDLFKRLCNKEAVGLGGSFNFANRKVMINLDANSIKQNDSSMFSKFLVKHLGVTRTSYNLFDMF